jgi:hypothetical protein
MEKQSIKEKFNSVPAEILHPGGETEILFNINSLSESNFKKLITYYDSISVSPIEFLITGTLTALSGAIGKMVFFDITDSLRIYLNIYAVIIGVSSISKKTTAINTVKKELERISAADYNSYLRESKEYQKAKEISKQDKTDLIEPIRNYLILPSDSTIEALTDILSKSNRGLIVHSEFGGFLQQLNRSYSGDSKAFLTAVFDVPESYEISRATKQNILIQRPFISILGASVIDWIKENSSPADLRSGFFARFLFSIRNKADLNKKHIPLLKLKELTSRSEHYFNPRPIYDYLVSLSTPIELSINQDAAELHINYDTDSYMEMIESMNENELSFKARLVIYCLKIAGIIALADQRTTVSLNDMRDAIHLTNYYKKNAERLLNDEMSQTEFNRSEKRVLFLIRANGGKLQHSKLLQLGNFKTKELTEIISNLTEKEQIEIISEKTKYNKFSKFYKLK